MIISAIEKQKNEQRFNIFVDGEFFCGLEVITVLKNHLKVGMEIDQAFLLMLKDKDNGHRAKDKALDYLGYSQHSKQNLTKKLKRAGFEDVYIEDAIENLEQSGLINDEKHAKNLCEYYYQKKLYGKNRVVMELIKKGIDNNLAKQASEDKCPDDFNESILKLIDKKCKNKTMLENKEKDSLVRFLINYGHEYSDIKMALSQRFNAQKEQY